MTALEVGVGAALCVAVSVSAATVAGVAWRTFSRAVLRRDGVAEPVLALLGLVGTASVLTVGLLLLWRVPWGGPDDAPEMASPAFAASLIGTVGGHCAVLAWARAIGAPIAFRRPTPAWMLGGVAIGFFGLLVSTAWAEAARAFGHPMADQALVETLLASPNGPARTATLLFVVAVAPVFEELVFRGYLQTAIGARLGNGFGIATAAVLFGLFHLSDPAVVPALTAIGALLGWVRHRSGSVHPAIAGHLVNNVVAMALAFS